jgi:hypothetical protein
MDVDLIEVGRQRPLVAVLGAIRILLEVIWQRLHGEDPHTSRRASRLAAVGRAASHPGVEAQPRLR